MKYNYYQGVSHEGVSKSKQIALAIIAAGTVAIVALTQSISAVADTVVVTPGNTQGWSTADTRANGDVNFVADADTPFGTGALSLTTGAAVASQDKAQYLHAANTPLADVTALAYWTKQVSASFVAGLPSYQLLIDADGTVGDGLGFTTLVYEPYNNFGNAAVLSNTWQAWDVNAGTLWSSRNVAAENVNGGLVAGGGGAPFYSVADVQAKYPNAVVIGFGVNVGSNNPNWDTRADGVVFNDTTYDFEVTPYVASNKDECKNGGWMNFQTGYKNQGQCVSSVAKQQ
jgi:hypothetical protein